VGGGLMSERSELHVTVDLRRGAAKRSLVLAEWR
jgi:hypothetical protein